MLVSLAVVALASVLGGIIGVAIGAVSALGLAGIVIVGGELVELFVLDGTAVGLLAALGAGSAPITAGPFSGLGLGPLLGPHVAFAGGVAGAASAGRTELFDPGFRYHQAKQIRAPLFRQPRAVVVGGVFGLVGVGLAAVASVLPLDPVAFAVVVSALLVRLTVGYPLLGRVGGDSWLDMSPFEAGAYWGDGDHDVASAIAGRHVVEPWQPKYYEWLPVAVIGTVVGIVAAGIALLSGSVLLPFGVALVSLFGLVAELQVSEYPVPVTHHIALPAAIGALAVGASPPVGIACGAAMGLLGALFGELAQRGLYAHGDTHVDPAFASLLLSSLLVSALVFTGVFDASAVPYL